MGKVLNIPEKLILPGGVASTTRCLFEYWCSLREQDIVPNRSDLRPAAMLPLLPNLMILEYRTPGTLIYRLAGTASAEKLGIDFTGSNLLDHIAPRQRREAEFRMNVLRTQPCGLIAHEALRSRHQTPFVAEVIFLPLRDRHGEITQLIGSSCTIEQGDKGAMAGTEEAMITVAADFLDIGASMPQFVSSDVRRAI